MPAKMKKLAVVLGILQCFVAVMAVPAGLSLILEPDGSGIGLPTEILQTSPFRDYLIPGLFLFVFNGIFQVIGAVASFRKSKHTGMLGLGLGIILLLWIVIQVYFTGLVHFLQPLFFMVAIIEIMLGSRLNSIEASRWLNE